MLQVVAARVIPFTTCVLCFLLFVVDTRARACVCVSSFFSLAHVRGDDFYCFLVIFGILYKVTALA